MQLHHVHHRVSVDTGTPWIYVPKINTHTDLPFWARYDISSLIVSMNGQRMLLSDSAYAQKRLIFGYSVIP